MFALIDLTQFVIGVDKINESNELTRPRQVVLMWNTPKTILDLLLVNKSEEQQSIVFFDFFKNWLMFLFSYTFKGSGKHNFHMHNYKILDSNLNKDVQSNDDIAN